MQLRKVQFYAWGYAWKEVEREAVDQAVDSTSLPQTPMLRRAVLFCAVTSTQVSHRTCLAHRI